MQSGLGCPGSQARRANVDAYIREMDARVCGMAFAVSSKIVQQYAANKSRGVSSDLYMCSLHTYEDTCSITVLFAEYIDLLDQGKHQVLMQNIAVEFENGNKPVAFGGNYTAVLSCVPARLPIFSSWDDSNAPASVHTQSCRTDTHTTHQAQ